MVTNGGQALQVLCLLDYLGGVLLYLLVDNVILFSEEPCEGRLLVHLVHPVRLQEVQSDYRALFIFAQVFLDRAEFGF